MTQDNGMNNGQDLFSYFQDFSATTPKEEAATKAESSTENSHQSHDLTDDEKNAIQDDGIDEEALDHAELGGQLPANSDNKKKENKQEKSPKITHTTYVCYASLKLPIHKFFTEDKFPFLTLEDIRKRLEKDFPELSKQRTKMDWDEKQNIIVPMVTGGKKGAHYSEGARSFFYNMLELQQFKSLQPINIIACHNGFYEIRENPIGVFIIKRSAEELAPWKVFETFVSNMPALELLESGQEGFKMYLPRVESKIFFQIISFFSDFSMHDVEVMAVLYWDGNAHRYIVDIPIQIVSKVSVNHQYSDVPGYYYKVAEIHSHNTMPAYFSSTDDEDELGTMLYGVIGNLLQAEGRIRFDIKTRAGVSGKFIELLPAAWTETSFVTEDDSWNLVSYTSYPDHWTSRVTLLPQIEVKA